MLLRRNKPATTAAGNGGSNGHAGADAEDDEDEDGEYGAEVDAEYDDSAEQDADDADTDGEYDEDAEYDDSAEDEYDEDADDSADEDADDSAEDEYDDSAENDDDSDNSENDDEDFTPPTAMSAIRNSLRSGRPRAQPATGTEEDGRRVNFIDKRERLIGYFLGVAMMALAVVAYIHYHHLVYPQDITTQNAYRREAPWLLVITLGLGLFIVLATLFKRRAALGFTLLLAGAGNPSGQLVINLIYLGTGLWLIFRAMRRSPSKAARLRAGAGAAGGAGARRGASSTAGSRTSTATTGTTAAGSTSRTRTAASTTTSGRTIGRNGRLATTQTSGRYTPPKPTRRPPPTVQPESEPSNRLASWLKK